MFSVTPSPTLRKLTASSHFLNIYAVSLGIAVAPISIPKCSWLYRRSMIVNRNIVLITAVVLLLALAALAFVVFRTPEEASAPIEAVPLAIESPGPATAPAEPATVEPAATAEPTATATPGPTATAEPVAEPIATAAPEPTMAPEPVVEPAAPAVFEIVPAESQARFIIDEVLRGAPVTVVGATDQVAGQIAIDVANPGATQVGQILVNARTLATDNDFRNRAIKNQILNTRAPLS